MLCVWWQHPSGGGGDGGGGGVVSAGLAVLSTAIPRGWCHHVHVNSAQIIVSTFYILT